MKNYTIALAVKWEYDWDFIRLIEKKFQTAGYSTFIISTYNLDDVTQKLKSGDISFSVFLDRGSDEDENFQEIADILTASDTVIINEYDKIETAVDKSIMHLKLEREGILLPFTLIVPSYDDNPHFNLEMNDLNRLGKPFVAKPAYYSGGGEGVSLNSYSMEDVNPLRKILHDDKYLLQKLITPKTFSERRIWFRSFWFFNEAVPLWWDDKTHIYKEINPDEFETLGLKRLVELTTKIADICRLDYFSCEATINKNDDLILIDYVNDQCDMRFKSKHQDGVPDVIVERFVDKMLHFVKSVK